MARRCQICGKKASRGNSVSTRGMSKKKGGVGKKTTGITRRRFLPNVQKVKVTIGGKTKRIFVCASCLKSGKTSKLS